ncbi:MAG TPA: hypothetical protein VGD79_04475 [Thermoanaerobaculia bacterium]
MNTRAASAHHRDRLRRKQRRTGWERPYLRAHRALDASVRLIVSTLRVIAASRKCAHRRPVRASRNLWNALNLLITASRRVMRAAEALAAMGERIEQQDELFVQSTLRWVETTAVLNAAAQEVSALHNSVLDGIESGTLVPEPVNAGRRPRIILAPRPVPLRAFLRLRQRRAVDRIAPLLRRRRRIPRPAALRVPHRPTLGRAPPLSLVAAF